jgi:hypothetical protein
MYNLRYSGICKLRYLKVEVRKTLLVLRSVMLSQLLWHHRHHGPLPMSRVSIYRAPSWSWASMDGSIDFHAPGNNSDMSSRLKDIKVETLTEDRFGQVKSVSICIAGSIKVLSYKSYQECTGYMELSGIHLHDNFFLHAWDGLGFAHWDTEYSSMKDMDRLHFLPLRTTRRMNHEKIEGLLLLPTMKAKGQFYRCGVLRLFSKVNISRGTQLKSNKLTNPEPWYMDCEQERVSRVREL